MNFWITRYAVIATGAKPRKLDIQGQEHITTSDRFLDLDSLPQRLVFIGGGYRVRATAPDSTGRSCTADSGGSGDPKTLRQSSHGAPSDLASTARIAAAGEFGNNAFVVKTSVLRHCRQRTYFFNCASSANPGVRELDRSTVKPQGIRDFRSLVKQRVDGSPVNY
jgi:hypothetical protein